MPKQFRWLLLFFEIAIAVLFAGCLTQLWDVGAPPYAITNPVYRISGPDDACSLGGVFFDFYNKSEKEVIFIQTCMNVFDKKTKQEAFAGAVGLVCDSNCIIRQQEKKNLCIPLDDYLWQLQPSSQPSSQSSSQPSSQSSSLCVDNFFISKIEYSDGSCWQDKFGVYSNSCLEDA